MLLTQPDTKAVDWRSFGVLVCEMLFGLLPFWNKNRDLMYQSIVFNAIRFPFSVSFDAQNLIFRLLNRNPAQRIGAGEEGSKRASSTRSSVGSTGQQSSSARSSPNGSQRS
jgi:serine/threonine protein kinase